MFKKKVKFAAILITFVLLLSFVSPSFVAAKETESFNEEVEELAQILEFVFEEAAIIDSSGNIIDLDFEKIESKYGEDPKLRQLQREMKPTTTLAGFNYKTISRPNSDYANACLNKKIKNNWKETLALANIGAIIDYALQKEFGKAAASLVKAGVRSNLIGISATLALYTGQCIVKAGNQ